MLEKGKVIECGTHAELMAIENGKYAEMSRLALGEATPEKPNASESTTDTSNGNEVRNDTFDEEETTAINTPLPTSRAASPELR